MARNNSKNHREFFILLKIVQSKNDQVTKSEHYDLHVKRRFLKIHLQNLLPRLSAKLGSAWINRARQETIKTRLSIAASSYPK